MKRVLLRDVSGRLRLLGGAAVAHHCLPLRVAGGRPAAAARRIGPLPAAGNDVLKLGDRFEAVARHVSPAVVAIEATKPPAAPTRAAKPSPSRNRGSGVLIRADGQRGFLVLTNNHVIAAGRRRADHRQPGRRPDLPPGAGLGRPRIGRGRAAPGRRATTCRRPSLGDSDRLRVGQWVLAIGSPFGLNQTVTHGIISARERGQVSLGSTIRIKDFLQTDAAINPGSSGGPLVNLDGEVIGINTAIASHSGSNSGVAFSIPINLVKRVMRQLLEKGSVSRGYLGLQLAAVVRGGRRRCKLGLDRAQGALVETVYPDTPAAAAGLRANDVVLQVDGVAIRNENHLINLISGLAGRAEDPAAGLARPQVDHPGRRGRRLVEGTEPLADDSVKQPGEPRGVSPGNST